MLFEKLIEPRKIVQSLPRPYDDEAWTSYIQGKGYAVTPSTAMKTAVVIRCADVVAKTIASLGCHLYKKTDKEKMRAETHGLYKILRMLPNDETTSYEFWHMYVFNLMLTKGAYAKIERDQNGFVKALYNIPTCKARMNRNTITNERYVEVFISEGRHEILYEGNFMFTPGLRFEDGEEPEDFIKIASDVLGLTMALNGYAKDYFESGSNLGGFVEYPGSINDIAFKKFKEEWQQAYSGVVNQHKWALLEGGFKLTKFENKPEEAQALESRKFQIAEVCRIMGVTPHKVFDLDRATFNNIEHLNIEYVQETIDPMTERIEQSIYKDCLSLSEQKKYYAKFNTNKLLKGDTATRTTYYNSMRQNGVFTTNDILDLEDRNLISEEQGGDLRLVNGNLIPLTTAKNNMPKAMQKGAGNNAGGNQATD